MLNVGKALLGEVVGGIVVEVCTVFEVTPRGSEFEKTAGGQLIPKPDSMKRHLTSIIKILASPANLDYIGCKVQSLQQQQQLQLQNSESSFRYHQVGVVDDLPHLIHLHIIYAPIYTCISTVTGIAYQLYISDLQHTYECTKYSTIVM